MIHCLFEYYYLLIIVLFVVNYFCLSAIHGLNHSGDFHSETVQFGFPYRIVVASKGNTMIYYASI